MMCICKHCFPPMLLLVFAMKCCNKMPCPLPHNHYCCLLSSPICLPHLLICICLISSPTACPPSSVLCWCLLRLFFCFFFIYLWYMQHFFVTPFWIVCVHIFDCCYFLRLNYYLDDACQFFLVMLTTLYTVTFNDALVGKGQKCWGTPFVLASSKNASTIFKWQQALIWWNTSVSQ